MFEKMGFQAGKGCGKNDQGSRRFDMPHVQNNTAGLGFGRKNRSVAHKGAKEKYPGMNGWYVKEGEDAPYYGFSRAYHFRQGQTFPGFDMLVIALEEVLKEREGKKESEPEPAAWDDPQSKEERGNGIPIRPSIRGR